MALRRFPHVRYTWGEKLIGQLLGGGRYPYRLESRALHIHTTLTKGYEKCAVYEEAKEITKGN